MPRFIPSSHTTAQVATIDGADFVGQGAGALYHELLVGDAHSTPPAAMLKPITTDPDGFPSGRATNQRVITTSAVKLVG